MCTFKLKIYGNYHTEHLKNLLCCYWKGRISEGQVSSVRSWCGQARSQEKLGLEEGLSGYTRVERYTRWKLPSGSGERVSDRTSKSRQAAGRNIAVYWWYFASFSNVFLVHHVKNPRKSQKTCIRPRFYLKLESLSVQFSSVAQSCLPLCDPMNCRMPGLPVHHQFPEFTQTHVHRVGDAIQHLILCRPLLLLPPIPPSIRVFSNESTLRMRWPEYWNFSFSIIPSKEIPGLISFRIDWLDLLAVQGTLKSLLQHHSSKASILRAQLSSQSNSHIHTWLLEKP